eukprot:gnl/TRDRNA2_/TRDRNA2_43498_c0_seq1.p1 gnl/TRDRNA2_/TRDRNA2_43498_c0~~gnl/TRDRNA2_/TRDRNA2_43498_c0_seq1.p1  ORF type:complete len:165 (+),score=11.67 gnl/TRDRNA2_/TRDRNA2_43498_c0_seq1:105-599(+)
MTGCPSSELPTLPGDPPLASWDCAELATLVPHGTSCRAACPSWSEAVMRCSDGVWRGDSAAGDWSLTSDGSLVATEPCRAKPEGDLEIIGDHYTPTGIVIAIFVVIGILLIGLAVVFVRFNKAQEEQGRVKDAMTIVGDHAYSGHSPNAEGLTPEELERRQAAI